MLNDRIYRPVEIAVEGERVKFVKLAKRLFGFGVVDGDGLGFSDVEKTLLDLVYISRYRSVPEEKTISTLEEYGKKAKRGKMKTYLRLYPKTVERVVKSAGLV